MTTLASGVLLLVSVGVAVGVCLGGSLLSSFLLVVKRWVGGG